MIRFPVYSLAFMFIAGIGGVIFFGSNEDKTLALVGAGSLLGYIIWIAARLRAVREGKPVHLGSVLNILVCTLFAVGIGLAGISKLMKLDIGNVAFWLIVLSIAGLVIWAHVVAASAVRWLPTGREIAREAWETVKADDIGGAAVHATIDVARDLKDALRNRAADASLRENRKP